MKYIFFGLAVCISLTINNACADESVTVGEASIAFLLPDGWNKSSINDKPASPTMDSSNPLFRVWKHKPILDPSGRSIEPGLNITVFNVPSDANVSLMSSVLMHRRSWPFSKFLTSVDDGLSLPNSHGYLTEFLPAPEIRMRAFVIHAINHGKFVEIVLSSTNETFEQVLPEFRSIIQSLRADKDRSPILFEIIDSLLPTGVTIASATKVSFGVQVGICARNPASLMKFLQSVEESVGLYQITKISGLHSPIQVGQVRKPMRFDVVIYGDTSRLVDKSDDNGCS